MDSFNSSSSNYPMTNYTHPFINSHKPNFPENDIINCSSKLDQEEYPNYPLMFNNFPSSPHVHLEYEDVYLQLLDHFHQHQSSHLDHPISAVDQEATGKEQDMNIDSTVHVINQTSSITKRRCSKKDRHSKINTALGPRDRRMRLCLDVARKFFDLQDMLGYDKPSRTVEWLLNNSKPAIRELERSRGSACCASSISVDDCDVVSSSINQSTTVGSDQEALLQPSSACTKMKRIKKIIKVDRASVSRESRTKARERARERTSQKRRLVRQSSTDDFRREFRSNIS